MRRARARGRSGSRRLAALGACALGVAGIGLAAGTAYGAYGPYGPLPPQSVPSYPPVDPREGYVPSYRGLHLHLVEDRPVYVRDCGCYDQLPGRRLGELAPTIGIRTPISQDLDVLGVNGYDSYPLPLGPRYTVSSEVVNGVGYGQGGGTDITTIINNTVYVYPYVQLPGDAPLTINVVQEPVIQVGVGG